MFIGLFYDSKSQNSHQLHMECALADEPTNPDNLIILLCIIIDVLCPSPDTDLPHHCVCKE